MIKNLISPAIRHPNRIDRDKVVDLIARAFAEDPVARWLYPSSRDYDAHFPHFIRAFGGDAFEHKSALILENFSAAALWMPPDCHAEHDPIVALLRRSVASAKQEAVFQILEQMEQYHPKGAHWYLPMIGTDPVYQGQGLGSRLIRHALKRCDENGMPAYLESSNPSNLSLYRRHGFELIGTIQSGDSPKLFPMLRPAR